MLKSSQSKINIFAVNKPNPFMKKNYLFALLLATVSCSDHQLTLDKPIEPRFKGSTLEFDGSVEIVDFVMEITSNSASASRVKQDNFVSFNEAFKSAVEEISAAETIELHDQLVRKHSDILSIIDETYVPKITNVVYRNICNREGLYESGGFIHKVIDEEYLVFTESENFDLISSINSIDDVDSNKVRTVKYQHPTTGSEVETGRSMAACTQTVSALYHYNPSNCKNDRRVSIRASTSFVISGNLYKPVGISETYGEIRNSLCNWRNYTTTLQVRNCSLEVILKINNTTTYYPKTFVDYSTPGDQESYILWNAPLFAGTGQIEWMGGLIPSIGFTRVHEEATSRGVAGNWAILDCSN